MKTYHFGLKLQSRELNLVLRKFAMIVAGAVRHVQDRFRKVLLSGFQSFFAKSCKINQILFSDRYHLQNGRFRKSSVRISMYFGEIKKGQSIIFQVIFHIDGDFNNSRKEKNTILESSYKAVN